MSSYQSIGKIKDANIFIIDKCTFNARVLKYRRMNVVIALSVHVSVYVVRTGEAGCKQNSMLAIELSQLLSSLFVNLMVEQEKLHGTRNRV